MKKVSDNFKLAGNRNWYKGRINYCINNLKDIKNSSVLSLTPVEISKINLAINFLNDINIDWKESYDEIRKVHKMKTYEKV